MKDRRRLLGMLSLLSVITYVDRVCISVAGPRMQDELGITAEAWGWVAGAFAAAQAGSFLLSISYGYLVKLTGSYDVALMPVAGMLFLGAALWFRVDPTVPIIPNGALTSS